MCPCGGELTAWCYECGDSVCEYCGCDADHEDDLRECASCGDLVGYLSSDDLCDGCVFEQDGQPAPVQVITVEPAPRYL
jgi:hypothetical protein